MAQEWIELYNVLNTLVTFPYRNIISFKKLKSNFYLKHLQLLYKSVTLFLESKKDVLDGLRNIFKEK
jgi:hypothetical protein